MQFLSASKCHNSAIISWNLKWLTKKKHDRIEEKKKNLVKRSL